MEFWKLSQVSFLEGNNESKSSMKILKILPVPLTYYHDTFEIVSYLHEINNFPHNL